MERRDFIKLSAAATLHSMHGAAAGMDEEDRLRMLLDAFAKDELTERPQLATVWGLDVGPLAVTRSKLNDYSSGGRDRWLASRRSRLRQLQLIDRSALPASAQVSHDVVKWQYEREIEGGERFPFGDAPSSGRLCPVLALCDQSAHRAVSERA